MRNFSSLSLVIRIHPQSQEALLKGNVVIHIAEREDQIEKHRNSNYVQPHDFPASNIKYTISCVIR